MRLARFSVIAGLAIASPLAAQERVPIPLGDGAQSEPQSPPQRIDLTPESAPLPPPSDADVQECEEEVDASAITGEIIVCRQRGDDPANWYSGSAKDWAVLYARESAYINDPQAPNVDNTAHQFAGAGVGFVLTGCFIPPCPGPHPLMIDVEALPPPPKESDADRIARGLPAISEANDQGGRPITEEELGLPPVPNFSDDERP